MARDTAFCTVIRHLPFGMLVQLDSGERGIILAREISWDAGEKAAWNRRFPVGDRLEAVILSRPEGKPVELSLRLAQDDPWARIDTLFQPGQVTRGTVTGVRHYGVFVELHQGVTGLVHHSRMPGWCKGSLSDLFWPGDWVIVQVQAVDHQEKKISLALAPMPFEEAGAAPPQPQEQASTRQSFERLVPQEKGKSILIVEADAARGKEMKSWLDSMGLHIWLVMTTEEGLSLIDSLMPDLVIAGQRLPGMDGAEFLHAVSSHWPSAQGVLIAPAQFSDAAMEALEKLQRQGIIVLIEPVQPQDLLDVLLAEKAAHPPSPIQPIPSGSVDQGSLAGQRILSDCLEVTEFRLAVLFRYDPVNRTAERVDHAGDWAEAQPKLDSLAAFLIRNVAEDGDLLRVEDVDAGRQEARFRPLCEAIPFQSCLAVPVPQEVGGQYALFLFHPEPREIYDDEVTYARAAAVALGAWVDRRTLLDQLIKGQRMLLLGQLSSYLAHELNHGLSPLNNSIRNLQIQLERCAEIQKDSPAEWAREIEYAQDYLRDLSRSTQNLTGTMRAFRDFLVLQGPRKIRLDSTVVDILSQLQQLSMVSRVRLLYRPLEQLVVIRAQQSFLQMVLLNLMLNAIHMVSSIQPQEGGRVQVRVERAVCDSRPILRVRVEDNGPGIHWRLWEKIFEPGFTTREGGSGLGLYIARSLAEQMGGRLYVLESFVASGSIFAFDLPDQI